MVSVLGGRKIIRRAGEKKRDDMPARWIETNRIAWTRQLLRAEKKVLLTGTERGDQRQGTQGKKESKSRSEPFSQSEPYFADDRVRRR